MNTTEIIAVIAIILIVGGAVAYIIKAKKSGKKCIGCPESLSCSKSCGRCSGCCCSSKENSTINK